MFPVTKSVLISINVSEELIVVGVIRLSPLLTLLYSSFGCHFPRLGFARKQIELFEAKQEDVDAGAQGRNKPIILGQVGIRCIHVSLGDCPGHF